MIPANDMLTKKERIHIQKTKGNPNRPISKRERKVLLASLEEYKKAGSESSKMILWSVTDILGL